MRLNSIKLSGFKSFADPTSFALPGQLVGVVGPNGCGKSNIMDAVRWVLGESKASELRGESMQDVIFSGTTGRKPAGRASVELVFDNADHRAGGQWGAFAEVAVKRILSRDGASSYYLNNQPVRRRDVQDVFLGTGLGPRAYAIIGQGTISRIIESRPEELRLFLEEAAGVSKYKERRRETASRLADTHENLTRVDDILRELGANLERLEKQAEVALRHNALQASSTLKQHQLWFLKHAESEAERSRVGADLEKSVNDLESRIADLRRVENELETVRQAHYAAGDLVNQTQGVLYEASAEVGRLEAEIRRVADARQRVGQRLAQLGQEAAQWAARGQDAGAESDTLAEKTLAATRQSALLTAEGDAHQRQLPALEDALRRVQAEAGEQRAGVTQVQHQLQLLAAEQRHIQEQLRTLDLRRDRLRNERDALKAPDQARLTNLNAQLANSQAAEAAAESGLRELTDTVPRLDESRRGLQQSVNIESARRAELTARLQALEALQAKVATDGKLKAWLARHGLENLPALWSRLQVEAGWENALEAALRERLGALEVSGLDMARNFDGSGAPPAKLALYMPPVAAASGRPHPAHGLKQLAAILRPGDAGLMALLDGWLHGCLAAPTMAEALAARDRLEPGEAIFVPAGHAVSRNSVSFYAPDSEQAGLLTRAQEIENLRKSARAQQLISEEAASALGRAELAYAGASQRLAAFRREAAEARNRVHALQVEALRLNQAAEQSLVRGRQIDADIADIEHQAGGLRERSSAAGERFQALEGQMAEGRQRQTGLEEQVAADQRRLTAAREQQRALERQSQEVQFTLRSLASRAEELARAVAIATSQAASIADEQARVGHELTGLDDAGAQAGLQTALNARHEREADLAAHRGQYDSLSRALRASDEQRLRIERELDPLRQRITALQLKEQAARLGALQFTELLAEAAADLPTVEASIHAGDVRVAGLQADIDRLLQAIEALGAVNLAALDELGVAAERKQFLDAQSADLNEAMATLEDAIGKIDMETRALLASTFDAVNGHFGRMFPELFGGGNARLVMTGGEILDAGVQVMAQPPGKKNQTIHLLSGGEKALTAIALVFAIFQLNPAPFCLLDEVDAPLDDANTERYAKLVTHMSRETQFLFISHNKIAMEMAEQLIGVTMQEQGVSRIVAVDLRAALSLAEAA